MTNSGSKSFLSIIERCNNFQLPTQLDTKNHGDREEERLIPFYIYLPDRVQHASVIRLNTNATIKTQQDFDVNSPIGFLRPCVVRAMIKDNQDMLKIERQTCWKALYSNQNQSDTENLPCCVGFEDWINRHDDPIGIRTLEMERLLRSWKESDQFLSLLAGWRDEKYTIYAPGSFGIRKGNDEVVPDRKGSRIAFQLERSGCQLFSFLTFGAHLTAYVIKDDEYHFWVPRRSPTKQTYPSMLDNTVGGGITAGESARQTIIRECFEEASLPEGVVLRGLKSTGLISYVHKNSDGWVSPEVQYIYDLRLSSDIIPKSNDGESIDYTLMSFDQLRTSLLDFSHEWKPNCALVLIDFFIRHGLIDDENEVNFLEICLKLKEPIPLPGP